jgi:hypothetical protein
MSRRAARGPRIKACPGPTFVWVFAATALSCSASPDFLTTFIRGAVVNNRAAVVNLLP